MLGALIWRSGFIRTLRGRAQLSKFPDSWTRDFSAESCLPSTPWVFALTQITSPKVAKDDDEDGGDDDEEEPSFRALSRILQDLRRGESMIRRFNRIWELCSGPFRAQLWTGQCEREARTKVQSSGYQNVHELWGLGVSSEISCVFHLRRFRSISHDPPVEATAGSSEPFKNPAARTCRSLITDPAVPAMANLCTNARPCLGVWACFSFPYNKR